MFALGPSPGGVWLRMPVVGRQMSVFAMQARPEVVKNLIEHRIVDVCQTFSAENNNIQGRELGLVSEGFANPAFDPVSLHRMLQVFL